MEYISDIKSGFFILIFLQSPLNWTLSVVELNHRKEETS